VHQNLFGSHQAPSLKGEAGMATVTETMILPICCVCGLIRADKESKTESWVTKQVFRQTHGIDHSSCRLTHTYCPSCYTQFMDRIAAA
jgi:hypothetical protein